jgi:hypothetical protein
MYILFLELLKMLTSDRRKGHEERVVSVTVWVSIVPRARVKVTVIFHLPTTI